MFLCSLRYCLKCYFSKGVYSFTLSTVYVCMYACLSILANLRSTLSDLILQPGLIDNLPVLSEGRIFTTGTACSENRYALAAGTDPTNKTCDAESTGSCFMLHNSPECRLYLWSIRIKRRYAVLNVSQEQDIVRPPTPVQITDRYRILFVNLIARNLVGSHGSRGERGRGLQWQPVHLWWTPCPRGLRQCWKIMVATQNIDTLGPIWTFPLRDVLTFVASSLDINGCVWSYFEGTANLHCFTSCTLLYTVAKYHFFHVVTWKYIMQYLQKCEGCTHFCEILYNL